MDSMDIVWTTVICIMGFALFVCGVLMVKNRKVKLDDIFLNPSALIKTELYNEKGNRYRKIFWAIFIVGFIFLFSFSIASYIVSNSH